MNKSDVKIIRGLAARVAEIAALPVQEKKRELWRKLNALKPVRPMVMIDQVCWNEMNIDDQLLLYCTDHECREYEQHLRRILFQWKYFPVDMVVEPFIRVPMAIRNSGFGIEVREDTSQTDPSNDVVSHLYKNQFETEEDLKKVQVPKVSHDLSESERRLGVAHELSMVYWISCFGVQTPTYPFGTPLPPGWVSKTRYILWWTNPTICIFS